MEARFTKMVRWREMGPTNLAQFMLRGVGGGYEVNSRRLGREARSLGGLLDGVIRGMSGGDKGAYYLAL